MIIDPEFKVASLLLPGEERIQTVNPALPPSRGYLLPMLYSLGIKIAKTEQISSVQEPYFQNVFYIVF